MKQPLKGRSEARRKEEYIRLFLSSVLLSPEEADLEEHLSTTCLKTFPCAAVILIPTLAQLSLSSSAVSSLRRMQ